MGEVGPRRPLLGRADPALARHFPIGGGALPLGPRHPRARRRQEGGGARPTGARPAAARQAGLIRAPPTRSSTASSTTSSRSSCSDRLGHADQHERQRGDRQPRQPAAGGGLGAHPIHPNDHVNLRPVVATTSSRRRCTSPPSEQLERRLLPAIEALRDTLARKAAAFADVVKIGRTHLQDATPLTLGQEISRLGRAARPRAARCAHAARPARARARRHRGRHRAQRPRASREPWPRSSTEADRPALRPGAPNKFAALAAHDAVVHGERGAAQLAAALMKIANDVRWFASGPRGGIGELRIPENEPGSSIMPGKVNPTQAEALTHGRACRSSATTPRSPSPARRATSSSTCSSR